jgi:tetraacyldisaccharide 4'-kinase
MRRPWLLPLTPVYAAGAALRSAGLRLGLEPVRRLSWPVVSVGNLSTGGTGKTPFTIALARLLAWEGIHVDVLSRGYGRVSEAVERVPIGGSALRFGDEPLLIARGTGVPVYVGAQRYLAGRLAEDDAAGLDEAGLDAAGPPGLHLLDDGFQHRQLARQVDIVLVNREDLGDWLLPAGNLREALGALRRASVLAVAEDDDAAVEQLGRLGFGAESGKLIWRYRREMVMPEIPEPLAARPVVAFCGIARPEQFFSGLERQGLRVAARRAFPDHHRFTAEDLAMLGRLLDSTGSGALVTTAKDQIRLSDVAMPGELAGRIFAADLRVAFEDESGIMAWLRRVLGLTEGDSA